MPILAQIKKAIRASVPLVAITTPDPWATIQEICAGTASTYLSPVDEAAGEEDMTRPETPICKIEWDVVRGFTGRNKPGADWIGSIAGLPVTNPIEALIMAAKLPERGLLFVHLADFWLRDPMVLQACWNLRDLFKSDNRLLVLLSRAGRLPGELADDVMVFDEPLPDAEKLAAVVCDQYKDAGFPEPPTDELTARAVEALRGLSAFGAEQITAMSLSRQGLDIDALWSRKRQQIEQTPGLKVFRGGDETFGKIGGCEVVKGFLSKILAGNARPNAVVFVDEIEKMLGGARGDMSGVTQDQLGELLSYMQDHAAAGMIFIGPPGAAKSAVAKAAGDEAGIPTVQLDLGAAKGGLVGQSEQQLRAALKVITAVSNGKSLWIATCNSIGELPPELRRRFTLGTFFFDLPDATERKAIWGIWLDKYGNVYGQDNLHDDLNDNWRRTIDFSDEGWTGAEIRQCVDIAWRLGCSLGSAAEFVVPVSKSAAAVIQKLREQADGRFLSASYAGVFRLDRGPAKRRAVKLEE